jgi:hypothetical protein
MDPEYLSETEVCYELEVRGVAGNGSKDINKRSLKRYLKKEAGGVRPLVLLMPAEDEKKNIEEKLVSVEQTLLIEKNLRDVALMRRSWSSLHHCKIRVNCLIYNTPEDDVVKGLNTRIGVCLDKIGALKGIVPSVRTVSPKKTVHQEVVKDSEKALESDLLSSEEKKKLEEAIALTESLVLKAGINESHHAGGTDKDSNSDSDKTDTSSIESDGSKESFWKFRRNSSAKRKRHSSKKTVNVAKWCIKFNGQGDKLLDFLNEVDFMAEAEGVSDRDLYKSAYHLFEGDALKWYMAFHRSCKSWKQMVMSLKNSYLPKNNDFNELQRIHNRRQYTGENFLTFYSNMEILFNRLSYRVPSTEKLLILRRNMLPYLRTRLSTKHVSCVDRLLDLCKTIEDDNVNSLGYSVQSKPNGNFHPRRDDGFQTGYNIDNRSKPRTDFASGSGNAQFRRNFRVSAVSGESQNDPFFHNSNLSRGFDGGHWDSSSNFRNQGNFENNPNFSRVNNDNFDENFGQGFRGNLNNNGVFRSGPNVQYSQNFHGPGTLAALNGQHQSNFGGHSNPHLNSNPHFKSSNHGPNNNAQNQLNLNNIPSFNSRNNSNQLSNLHNSNPKFTGTPNVSRQSQSNVICFRCKRVGHPFQLCTVHMPNKVFCFRCGLDDVVTPNCPRCLNKGNGQ